ncbi:MAG: VWA domain-containing protein [Proteobacteria bacterium]|nr:VWA domain-containing protein [Pseudomonadota bacterium]
MFRFASPLYFVCLAIFPVLIIARKRLMIHPAMKLSRIKGATKIQPSFFLVTRHLVSVLKFLALALMITAMARPQWGTRHVNVMTEGINLILAVDVSGSMAALDFKKEGKIIDRLEAVKDVVRDFISKREGDRIGLVVFGTYAFTQLPLTRDYNTISFVLDKLKIGSAGESTAIGDAIGISIKRLEDIPSKSNVIILLTDGDSNAGELSPDIAASIASEKKVKIYTIGVGTRGKAPFRVRDPIFGERLIYQQVTMDEETLKRMADKTGGQYFRAENLKGLDDIYATINRLEKTEVKVKDFTEYKEFYLYFLIPSFFLLISGLVLENTRYLRIP